MGEGASVEQAKGLFSYARIGPTVGQPVGEGGWQEERYSTAVPAGEPSNEFGERRGVSPPVLHPRASPTNLRFQPAALRLAARSEMGRETRGSAFSCHRLKAGAKLGDGRSRPPLSLVMLIRAECARPQPERGDHREPEPE